VKKQFNALEHAMQTLNQVSACSKLGDKKSILHIGLNVSPVFGEILSYALDPYKKYGFAKAVPKADQEPTTGYGCWEKVRELLDRLRFRKVTGAEAATQVIRLMNLLSTPERQLLTRILLKDLRCGVGATLINSIKPGLVPEFGVMLATPLEEKHIKTLQSKSKIFLQAKKNGDRCVVICSDDPKAYSRKGHELLNYNSIVKQCADLCGIVGKNYVFDGEVINGDFFGTREVKKKAGNEAKNAVFHIFDIVSLEDWELGHTPPYSERRATLRKVMHQCPDEYSQLVRVPSVGIAGRVATLEYMEEWRDKFVELGEEGLIIRLDAPYNFATRSSLFKFKKMVEGDFTIVEILEGEAGKKYEGMAAKILVEGDVLGDGETCEVGLRGDVDFRKQLWKHRNKYVGTVCEVHYQELTRNKEGKPKLQFGVMTRLREDKS
jgi:DNA ligase-1